MARKLPPVHCRICGKEINRLLEVDGIDWIMPSKNFYYHLDCYNKWAKKNDDIHAKATDEEWYQSLLYYLNHVIKAPINYSKLASQWKNYLNQKTKTAKGVYMAVRYFYEVQKGDKNKSQGGIGIVSYIYEDSCKYWSEREEKEAGLCARIEEQIKNFAQKEKIKIKKEKIDKKEEAKKELMNALAKLNEEDDESE